MPININKYNSHEAYAADGNRPADESCVSLVAGDVVYNGVNVILDETQLSAKSVTIVVLDNVDGEKKYIPIETYLASKLDTSRYTVQNYFLFGKTNGKKLFMHKGYTGSFIWAERNLYKITCDTTAAGGFTWAVSVNGAAKGSTVEWAQGDTLDSIVAQMTSQAVEYYLDITHVAGEDFIRVAKGGWEYSVLTLSSVTGATLIDLSLYTKVNGVQQAETHRDWQTQAVHDLFPSSPVITANSAQYAKNGYNLSYACGGNLERFKAFYRTNGNAGWVAETSADHMKEEAFNSCADGTLGGEDGIALYNKYGGSWDAYMESRMIQIDDTHTGGIEYQSYDNGTEGSHFLASVTTMDFDGSYIPAYPAAYSAAGVTIDGQQGCLPTEHEMALFMEDERLARINKAITALGGTPISITDYIWGVAEYAGYFSWFYIGYFGLLDTYGKYGRNGVRPVLASA